MKSILNIFQIWYREIGNIFRDKGIMIFILFVPLAYPLLYSYVYTNEVVREVPVAVVDESHSELSRELLRKMDASPDMKIVAYCDNLSAAQEMIRRQEVYGIVRIPSDFTRELWKGNQAPIGLYCDMSSMLYYKALLLTATNVSLEVNKDIKVNHYLPSTTDRQAEITRMPIDYDYVPLYNPQSGFAAFLIPPVLMLIIQQTLLLGIGMSTGNSREHHMGSVIPFHPWPLFYALYYTWSVYVCCCHTTFHASSTRTLYHFHCFPCAFCTGMYISCHGTVVVHLQA